MGLASQDRPAHDNQAANTASNGMSVNRQSTYDTPTEGTPNGNVEVNNNEVAGPVRAQGPDTANNGLPFQEREGRAKESNNASTPRERSRATRRPSGQSRVCGKCGGHLTGQFVRALGDTYHLECFTCHVSASELQR